MTQTRDDELLQSDERAVATGTTATRVERFIDAWLHRLAVGPLPRFTDAQAFATFILATGGATAIRTVLLGFVPGLPYIFYFPAIVVVAVLAGARWGFATLAASVLLAWYFFIPPRFSFALENMSDALSLVLFAVSGSIVLAFPLLLRQSLDRLHASERRYRQLARIAAGNTWLTNARGEIDEAQEGWTALTGMTWPSFRGDGWLGAVHPDDVDQARRMRDVRSRLELRIRVATGDFHWFSVQSSPVMSGTDAEGWMLTAIDVTTLKSAQERLELVNGELLHRLKNLSSVMGAVARISQPKGDQAVDEFIRRYLGRMDAILRTGEAVLASPSREPDISDVARLALVPFASGDARQISIEGAPLAVNERTAGLLALAFHELATNSLKYGALSNGKGAVALTWAFDLARVRIEWRESGGPPVATPNKEGFGTRVIQQGVSSELDPRVELAFQPDGLVCRMSYARRRE